MKTIVKHACLVLLIAWGGNAAAVAQTAPKPVPHRFSGKIVSVDAKAKTITMADKTVVSVTEITKIKKIKVDAAFGDLAPGQSVIGVEHKDASGNWVADSVDVGEARRQLDAPVLKTFVAPDKPNTNTATKPGQG